MIQIVLRGLNKNKKYKYSRIIIFLEKFLKNIRMGKILIVCIYLYKKLLIFLLCQMGDVILLEKTNKIILIKKKKIKLIHSISVNNG